MTGLLSAIIFGLIAGMTAKIIHPGRDPGGCIVTSVIGIIGAILGQAIGTTFLHIASMEVWSFRNFLLAVLGSLIFLIIFRFLSGRKR